MGSHQGVVWNDCPFPIEYIVYGKFEELGDQSVKNTIDPNIEVSPDAVAVSGFNNIVSLLLTSYCCFLNLRILKKGDLPMIVAAKGLNQL